MREFPVLFVMDRLVVGVFLFFVPTSESPNGSVVCSVVLCTLFSCGFGNVGERRVCGEVSELAKCCCRLFCIECTQAKTFVLGVNVLSCGIAQRDCVRGVVLRTFVFEQQRQRGERHDCQLDSEIRSDDVARALKIVVLVR